MSDPVIAQVAPYEKELKPGTYWWCRCGQSKKQPFCDEPSGEKFNVSRLEPNLVSYADTIDDVVCFLKLPAFYQIPTPKGPYNPDFDVVLRRKHLRNGEETEFYFVIETKGTNDLADKKTFRESEVCKIKCASTHFDALGVNAHVN